MAHLGRESVERVCEERKVSWELDWGGGSREVERTGLNGVDGEEVVGVHVSESSAHCDAKKVTKAGLAGAPEQGTTDIARRRRPGESRQPGGGGTRRTEPLLGLGGRSLDDLEHSRLEGLDGSNVVGEAGGERTQVDG